MKQSNTMLRDIHDTPSVLRESIFGNEKIVEDIASNIPPGKYNSFFVIGCTTSLFGGLVGKYALEEFLKIPVAALPASEMATYPPPNLGKKSLVMVFSRSGETGDILEAVNVAKSRKSEILAITNSPASSLSRAALHTIPLRYGSEGLVMTKSLIAEMAVGIHFSIEMAKTWKTVSGNKLRLLLRQLKAIPEQSELLIKKIEPQLEILSRQLSHSEHIYILGNGPNHATALEGMLKIKEAALIHAEAFQGNEFRHGNINVARADTPIIALAPDGRSHQKMLAVIKDCKEANAKIVVECRHTGQELEKLSDSVIEIPFSCDEPLTPPLYIIPLHLFAYYAGTAKGLNVDHPKGSEAVGTYGRTGEKMFYYIKKT